MNARERVGFGVLATGAGFLVILVLALVSYVVVGGWSALSWEFVSQEPRAGMTEGGVFPAILGTVVLTLPWTISASEEALKTVPRSWRDGALALGATRWEAIRTNVLPAAFPGMLTGIILGLARAAGETAPILFTGVTFAKPDLPSGLGDTFMALPYHLYILATQHHDIDRARPIAFATATVLLVLVLSFNGGAAVLRARLRARARVA